MRGRRSGLRLVLDQGEATRAALSALTNLGFTKPQARSMVEAAPDEVREDLEQLLRHALRQAPRRR
jgi:Holliday junction resolvasome RuvABC DNA-binding subunit